MAVKGKAVAPKAEVAQDVKVTLLGAYQAVLDEARKEFEAGIQAQLADWKTELARVKEDDVYQFNIAKRDREDALKIELASRVASVTERETAVKEREVAIGDAEKTIAGLQATVDGISAIQVKAESIGYAKGLADADKEAKANARITEAETNAKVEILESRIEALQATVTTQVRTIENLQNELKAANARVQEIANNAVTAAGNSKVTVQNAPTAGR
jgi:uncharacterized coiled-coil protein SlyX